MLVFLNVKYLILEQEFIEMNAFTDQKISNKYCLKEYKDLVKFLKNSKNFEFNLIMGNKIF